MSLRSGNLGPTTPGTRVHVLIPQSRQVLDTGRGVLLSLAARPGVADAGLKAHLEAFLNQEIAHSTNAFHHCLLLFYVFAH